MSNVVEFPDRLVFSDKPIDPDLVLKNSIGKLESAIVIGYTHGEEEYFASSIPDGPAALWLMERFKKFLLEIMDE